MLIVRLSRDKRGLDTIYLVDSPPARRPSKARILYFWTAPPGLRVGRAALDPARQRELERAHPDLEFDWPELLRAVDVARQQAPPLNPDERREAWRGAARAGRSGGRAIRDTADPAPQGQPAVAQQPEQAPTTRDDHARMPQGAADSSAGASEGVEAPATRGRRRRRSRRPSDAGDSTRPAEPPIID